MRAHQEFTPAARRRLAFTVSATCAEAPELATEWGVAMDDSTLHALVEELGARAEAQFILHGWLRSGSTGAARGVVPFLQEALALLPEGTWLGTVRADSGFFDGAFLDFLEARQLPYEVVARPQARVRGDQGVERHR